MQRTGEECDGDERIGSEDQDEDLCEAGDVVVDEAGTDGGAQGHGCEGGAVEVGEEERFEEVVADKEVEDEDDGEDETGEGREFGDGFEGDFGDMWGVGVWGSHFGVGKEVMIGC